MKSDKELLQMIRDAKRKSLDPVELSLQIYPYLADDEHDDGMLESIKFDQGHFSMEPDTIIAQTRIAAKVEQFIGKLEVLHKKYVKNLKMAYGPVWYELYNQFCKDYLAEPQNIFGMKQTMVNLDSLAKGIAVREDQDESIFDSKRIEQELNQMETINGEAN